MNFMTIRLIFVLVFVLFQLKILSQTYHYKVEISGIHIGDMNVSRTVKDSITTYIFQSKVKFWLFGTAHINHYIKTEYKKKQLMTCQSTSLVNGTNYKSSIKWTGTYYDIDAHAYKYDYVGKLYEPIYWSVTKLYFDEPVNQTRIFAENSGVWAEIKLKERGHYEVKVINSYNQYYFQSGFLYKVMMDNNVKNFTMIKK